MGFLVDVLFFLEDIAIYGALIFAVFIVVKRRNELKKTKEPKGE